MRNPISPAGIVVRITLGVVIGGIVGFLIPYFLVRQFNYGVTGTGTTAQMRALFGFLFYTVPLGGIGGGFLAKRWNRKLQAKGR